MKYVLFTGATGGLGEPCIKALSERGYMVFAMGTNEKKLAELGSLPNVIPLKADVTSTVSVEAARRTVLRHTDRLDVLVNFAGRTAFCSMVEGNCIETTEALLAVNVLGMVRVNRIFFDLVYTGGGRIINCSSEAGWMTPQPFAAPYFLSKRAVEAYNDSLRRELMYIGVPVIKLQPGSFKTNMTRSIYDEFEKTVHETAYYKNILVRMKPLMENELKQNNDPEKLVRALLKAVEARRPKLKYRIGTGKLLAVLEVLPDKWLDLSYQLFFKLRS